MFFLNCGLGTITHVECMVICVRTLANKGVKKLQAISEMFGSEINDI